MDLDPFVRNGIEAGTMRFLDIFLLHCLLSDSPDDSPDEIAALARNQQRTAGRGREPGLLLERSTAQVKLSDWAAELLAALAPIADALDQANGGTLYRDALMTATQALREPHRLPSARVLATLMDDFDGSYVRFVRAQSEQTRNAQLATPLAQSMVEHFQELAAKSLAEQRAIEAADSMPFEIYRQQYLASERLGKSPQTRGGAAAG